MAGLLGMRTGPVRPGVAPCDPLELAECTAVLREAGLLGELGLAQSIRRFSGSMIRRQTSTWRASESDIS